MKTSIVVALALFAIPVQSQDRPPSAEQPLGPLSAPGTTIEVENYRCTVENERQIRCINIGRVCAAYRSREEKRSARRFGCGIPGNRNYPCPPDDPAATKDSVNGMQMCLGTVYGW